jgi:hypothetical protein
MPLLTELFAFLRCGNYKDFAPTELLIAPLKARPRATVFQQSTKMRIRGQLVPVANALC